jgi:GNAT superfamily N-acetyltransferase
LALPAVIEVEQASLKGWPALDTETDGSWVLRAAGGYTRRSNSIQSLDPADESDLAPRLERAVRWYRDRGLPPIYRITPLTSPAVISALDVADWATDAHSRIVARDLGADTFTTDADVVLVPPASDQWLAVQQQLKSYDDGRRERLRHIVERITGPARGLILMDNGEPVASALMAIANGIVITCNVHTATALRRRGYGRRMMEAGLAWARSAGARRAAHAVEAGNEPALALYGRLGYEPLYDYHYRVLAP